MRIYRIIFALAVVAFNAANYPSLFGRVGFYSRYGLLLLLVPATMIYAAKKPIRMPQALLSALYVFLTYAFVTTFWTENFRLSLLKWIIYVPVCLALVFGGIIVANEPGRKEENPFWVMKWIFVPLVFLSTYSLLRGGDWVNGNFRGYCGNSNALAATLILTLPWIVWEYRSRWTDMRYRVFLLGLSGLAIVILLCAHSRASVGAGAILLGFAGWGAKRNRKFVAAYLLACLLVGAFLVNPTAYSDLYQSWVEKRSESVMSSRSDQFLDSWEAAKKGGVFGVGFGVSTGASRHWDMNTFSQFSREKGNSLLAVMEELGMVGLALYLVLLYAILFSIRQVRRANDEETRFLYLLSIGFFWGALFHSQFEAWFLSSGPDVAVFWSVIGISIGTLMVRSRQADGRFPRMEAAARAGVFVPAPVPRR